MSSSSDVGEEELPSMPPEPVQSADLSWRVDAVLDAMQEGFQILGFDYRYLYVNQAAARHGRRERHELLGRTLLELYPGVEQSALFTRLQTCMNERTPQRMDNEFLYPDGESAWFELRMEPVPEGILLLSIDLAPRRLLEAQLSHAQKMEAVGNLAGGIAHDFNNLLTVILSYCDFMSDSVPHASSLHADVLEIRAAAQRGAGLTQQLLALGRRQKLERRAVSTNAALGDITPMLRRLSGERIELEVITNPTAGVIKVDPGQLDQVLMNLVANSRDAMPEGGRITLRTDNVTFDQAYADRHAEVAPGAYVMIAVSDTGCGMDEATLQRVFEPFFTTKAPGHGTGLGLATSHGIVRQNHGYIWVYSEVGHGTTFKLYFPRVFTRAAAPSPTQRPPATELMGNEIVLLVDDEASLRTLCARVLKAQGYTVLEAESPSEALRFSERYSGSIDALVTDVVMPEMSGPELAKQLLAGRPGLCVLFMSGYADHDLIAALASSQYLEKPFTPDGLSRKLREVLALKGVVSEVSEDLE